MNVLDDSLLDGFRSANDERGLEVRGVHVYVEGRGELAHRFYPDRRAHLWSGSKTFTSVAVGIAVDEGRFTLGDSALGFFPQFADTAAPGSEAITVRDLLHMCSGREISMFGAPESQWRKTDWARLFFADEVVTTPGTHFFYSSSSTYMLGRIVEATSGQVLRDYLVPRLFDPLGIADPQWKTCPGGHSVGGFGLSLRTAEFARLGRLLLQDGVWDDRQLVSAGYVQAMRTDVVPSSMPGWDEETSQGYGYQLWLNTTPGTYRADGMLGQYSVVLPQQRAVVTVTARNEGNAYDILRAVFADIVPRLG